MARCSFFTLDVSFYDKGWLPDVPDKEKSKCMTLDILLNGLVMRTYDIPTYDGDKQPPEVLRKRGICIEIPETKKILKFRTISDYIGWRKPRIVEVMNLLSQYGVITFHILKNNQVEINHLKALERLHPLQQKYFGRLGIKTDILRTKNRSETQSEAKGNTFGDYSPQESNHLDIVNRKREELKRNRT